MARYDGFLSKFYSTCGLTGVDSIPYLLTCLLGIIWLTKSVIEADRAC